MAPGGRGPRVAPATVGCAKLRPASLGASHERKVWWRTVAASCPGPTPGGRIPPDPYLLPRPPRDPLGPDMASRRVPPQPRPRAPRPVGAGRRPLAGTRAGAHRHSGSTPASAPSAPRRPRAQSQSPARPRLGGRWKAGHHGLRWRRQLPSGSTLGDRLAADPATALGTGVPALLVGRQPQHGQPRDGAHRRHLPRPATEVLRLLRPASADHRPAVAGRQPGRPRRTTTGRTAARPGLQMALWRRGRSPSTRSSASARTRPRPSPPIRRPSTASTSGSSPPPR